jgi:chromosome partitioning protein
VAAYALACGEKVAIVDLDPQHNAHDWYELRESPVPDVIAALPERLSKIKSAAQEMGVSLLLVDTPPHTTGSAVAAIRAADLIITPTQPNIFDILALKDTVALLKQADRLRDAACVVNGVSHQGEKSSFAEAQVAAEGMGLAVSTAYLVHRKPYATSLAEGRGVTEFEPTGKAAGEIRRLWEFLNGRNPVMSKSVESVK